MAKLTNLTTLAKTSVVNTDYLLVTNSTSQNSKKISVSTLFPAFATSGASSEDIWISITNKNQLNFKGIKSGDTGVLTVATTDNNIVLTALEAGIDLSLCNNTTSGFSAGVDFTGVVTGENAVVNGGTGLATIAKGAILYANAADTIVATAAPTNGQILMGNATLGYPVLNTLTAGTGMTIAAGAGTITLTASLTTMAGELDMSTYNVNLNTAAGASWISGAASQDEGLTVDVDGKVFIGEAAPTAFFESALNIKGSISFAADTPPTIKPKLRASSAGQKVTIEGGSASNSTGGDLDLKGGSSTAGNHNAGDLNLYGGDEAGSGTAGSIKNFVSNGSGAEVQSLTVTGGVAAPNVTVNAGNLIITTADKGIIHTNSGTVTQATNHTTGVTMNTTSGVIQLAAVALAAATNAEFTVTNSTVQADSVILITMQDENTVDNAQLSCAIHTVAGGSFKVSIFNAAATGATSTTASKIHFLVINNS